MLRAFVFCGLVVLVAVAGTVATATTQKLATSVGVADAACARCHADITKNYLSTPMANASGLAKDKFEIGSFLHQRTGVRYTFALQAAGPVFSYSSPGEAESSPAWTLQYFLGSGHLGLTYLYTINDYLFETPIANYAAHGLDLKPGLEGLTTVSLALPVQAECVRCHMSGVRQSDRGTLNRYSDLPFEHTGITCESCHGDAADHVGTGGKGSILNPAKMDADARDSVCISCHLEGDVSVDRAGSSMFDFKPGESISKYRSYFVYQKQDAAARGVSEVEQFNESTCKRKSGGAMSCTSCHDPHVSPTAEQRVQFYRMKCLACHTGPMFAKEHHPENLDCTSCHMQRLGAGNTPHVAWTDHRILRVPESAKLKLDVASSTTLLPILSPASTERDVGLAYYKGLLEGNASLESKAFQQLDGLKKQLSSDPDALNALGVLSEERGDFIEASGFFKQVLSLDKTNLIAASNLGTLLAKAGQLRDAIAVWEPVAARNQDVVGLTRNLALVKCSAGDVEGARALLQQGLQYSPESISLRQLLANLPKCGTGREVH